MLFKIAAEGKIELSFHARIRTFPSQPAPLSDREVPRRGRDEAEPHQGSDLPDTGDVARPGQGSGRHGGAGDAEGQGT